MTKSRNILPPRQAWSDDQLETLRINYDHWPTYLVAHVCGHTESSTYQKARQLGLSKSPEYLASPAAGRLQRSDSRGGATRFKPGQPSWNKGIAGICGTHPNSRRTQFGKGHRGGRALENYQSIGTERISKDGYLERKVNDDFPLQKRWKAVHRIVWEEANGPVPPGHAVVFRPDCHSTDASRIVVDGLELVSRGELMRRNSYHTRYPKEVALLIQLKGALNRKINRRTREAQA